MVTSRRPQLRPPPRSAPRRRCARRRSRSRCRRRGTSRSPAREARAERDDARVDGADAGTRRQAARRPAGQGVGRRLDRHRAGRGRAGVSGWSGVPPTAGVGWLDEASPARRPRPAGTAGPPRARSRRAGRSRRRTVRRSCRRPSSTRCRSARLATRPSDALEPERGVRLGGRPGLAELADGGVEPLAGRGHLVEDLLVALGQAAQGVGVLDGLVERRGRARTATGSTWSDL